MTSRMSTPTSSRPAAAAASPASPSTSAPSASRSATSSSSVREATRERRATCRAAYTSASPSCTASCAARASLTATRTTRETLADRPSAAPAPAPSPAEDGGPAARSPGDAAGPGARRPRERARTDRPGRPAPSPTHAPRSSPLHLLPPYVERPVLGTTCGATGRMRRGAGSAEPHPTTAVVPQVAEGESNPERCAGACLREQVALEHDAGPASVMPTGCGPGAA